MNNLSSALLIYLTLLCPKPLPQAMQKIVIVVARKK